MNIRHSIFFKLNLFFLLALLAAVLLFMFFRISAQQMELRREGLRGMELGRLLHHTRFSDTAYRTNALADAQFTLLPPGSTLPGNAREIAPPHHEKPGVKKPFLSLHRVDDTYYFSSRLPGKPFVIKDDRIAQRFAGVHLVFALLLAGVVTLYVLLRRSLMPLQSLHAQISRFSQGELNIDTSSPRHDEIAAIANEFNRAMIELRKGRLARQLFLRNIMHELKTPLTKGKLTLALMREDEHNAYLNRLLSRMDELINRIAEIEKAQSGHLQRRHVAASELIERAVALLYLEQPHDELLSLHIHEDMMLHVDESLFVSALTNLIDNALKYADALPVILELKAPRICIVNNGAPLHKELDALLEPFSSSEVSNGMGLGLSIANTIIEAHGAQLRYAYANKKHHFCIDLNKGHL